MYVAVDASWYIDSGLAGLGCINNRGEHRSLVILSPSIPDAELEAIRLALESFPDDDLTILSDSLPAIYLLKKPPPHLRLYMHDIVKLASGRQVVVRWVKGHSTDPLNNTADWIARCAYRDFIKPINQSRNKVNLRQIIKEMKRQLTRYQLSSSRGHIVALRG